MPPAPHIVSPGWRAVDLISDLHLQSGDRATFDLWRRCLLAPAPGADALFILGDLFEVWWGDEVLDGTQAGEAAFLRECAQVLQQAVAQRPVYFMHGNRDFLVGPHFFERTGVVPLADPCALELNAQRYLLSHGDAWCLGDVDYQRFRAEVRTPAWQQAFLARPLADREATALALRQQSEARKHSGADYADVDPTAAIDALTGHGATRLVHGHTHRPADHTLAPGLLRHVLSDWDARATPPRAEVMRLHADGRVERLPQLQ
jgi:UDP-2,3-diacylglucosamine hydrolase